MKKYHMKLILTNYLFWIMATVLILLFMLMSFDTFTKKSVEHTFKVNESRLREFSGLNAGTFKLEMEKISGYIELSAQAFSYLEDPFSKEAFPLLDEIKSYGNFTNVWMVDGEGIGYSSQESQVDLSHREYFQLGMEGKSGMTDAFRSSYSQQNVFCLYAPIIKNAQVTGVLVGVLNLDGLNIDTAYPQFSGKGHAYVFDPKGKMIIGSTNEKKLVDEETVWDFLKQVEYQKGSSYEAFKADICAGKSGIVYYQSGSDERVGYYEPIGMNGWYMFSVVREDEILSYSDSINHFAVILVAEIALCFFAMTISVVLAVNHAQRKVLKSNYMLQITNQRFRIAAEQLATDIVEYDLRDRKLVRIGKNVPKDLEEEAIQHLEEDLIKGRTIEQESLSAFLQTLDLIVRGSLWETCLLKVMRADGLYEWYEVAFTNILFNGQPSDRAIGTIEDVTQQKEIENQFVHEEQQRKVMIDEASSIFVANLTKGNIVYAYGSKAKKFYVNDKLSYEQEFHRLIRENVCEEDQSLVAQEFSLEELKNKYLAGHSKTELEFRNEEKGTRQLWLKATVNFVVDPKSKDLKAYFYLMDITKAKLSQLALIKDAERDWLTGLYNRHTAQRLIREFLSSTDLNNGQIHAFVLIDFDNFKYINDAYGHMAGDFLLKRFGRELGQLFRKTDILGRLGGDEFIIFVKNASSLKDIEQLLKKINDLLHGIRLPQDEHHKISSSLGVCIVPDHGTELNELYRKSDAALYVAKRKGRNRYQFYDGQ